VSDVRGVALPVPVGMSAQIVTPGEEHRDQIARVLSTSLNFPIERALIMAPFLQLDDTRVAVVDDVVVATAGEFRFDQWFGGAGIGCCGITRVGTLPEHRAAGLATACTDALLTRARSRGTPIASLYPAVLRPYRRMGFEIAGSNTDHRVPIDGLPADPSAPAVELADADRDLAEIREAYRAWVKDAAGPVEPIEDRHWRNRILTRPTDATYRAVVVREDGRVRGFAAFSRVGEKGMLDVSFGVSCELMFATTPGALRGLMHYFRGFRGLGQWLGWPGPQTDPLALSLPETFVHTESRHDWMMRLLDVPAALEARGYPPVDADAVITVDDERWPDNAGPWRIEVRGGVAKVTPAPAAGAPRPIPVGTMSSLFSGWLRVPDAVRLGVLDADDASLDGLAAMFNGPDPWCPIFF
jgi:predicted acetyltransferase